MVWYDALGHFAHFTGPKVSSYIVEFIGTFFLVFTIGLNTEQKNPLAPLAIGSMLMVMIFMGGHISGAHYNPAVTLGVRLTGRDHITTGKAVVYIFLQLLAGFFAALTAYSLTGETWAPAPGYGVSDGKVFLVEFLFTFALVSVMLNTATTKSQSENSFFGLAIGFTVVASAFSAGPISGGAFNPAVATGLTILHGIISHGTFKHLIVYWAAEFLGSFLAAVNFRLTNSTEYRHQAALTSGGSTPSGYTSLPEDGGEKD